MLPHYKESQLFLKKASLRKVRNSFNIWRSFLSSKRSGQPKIKGWPISIAIEPTTACNLGCPECPSGLRSFTRPTGNLKQGMFESLIDELHTDLSYLTFYFQGEPYINPQFLDMVAYASERGVITATSTNAHFLDEENARRTVESGLDRLIISIDGTTQEVYEHYRRRGSLEKVIEGTKNIQKWKKKLGSPWPLTIFQFLVVRPNEHQIPEVYELAKTLGVDRVALKTAQVYDFEQGHELIPENQKYSRYKQLASGKWVIKNPLENHCWRMWSGCVITWDGKVVPCCFDKDAQYELGNAQQKSFKEIWQGPAYQDFRRQLLKGRKHIDICQNCSEGTQVWTQA